MAWNRKKNGSASAAAQPLPPPASGVNTIDAQTEITGNIKAVGNLRIDGMLVGDLECGATLIIGPQGSIQGNVTCHKAVIEGRFEGDIHVKEDLTLEQHSQLTGEVRAATMSVVEGASVSGRCHVPYRAEVVTDEELAKALQGANA